MERSSSQKALRILAILSIIGAVLIILFGVVFGGLGAGLIGSASPEEVADLTASAEMSQQELSGMLGGLGIVAVVSGIIQMICGILSLRAANDSSKIMPAWVVSIISLASAVFALVSALIGGDFASSASSTITSLVFAGLTFYLCNTIKAEAGK